ncbi:uncharacterized protein LOC112893661 [Panicum hallii]|uniref:uncharacterized protein LOC112893661 n=1 Tax=Panicum hallii TaxID=206008 RepID=UPI000DF4EA6A|nr:uncharacterized protein LOC112893661 [Panicum hallii]
MSRQSKRTSAPAPQAGPPLGGPGGQAVVPPPIPSMFGFGSWCPPNILPQPTTSSPAYCRTGLQQMGSSSTQVPWWTPPGVGAPSAQDQDVQAWGVDLHPPGGFVNLLNKNASNPTEDVNNGSSSQPINICDDTDYSSRTEKRLAWTKEEDLILIQSNQITRRMINIGKMLLLRTTEQSQRTGQGKLSTSKIALLELRKRLHGFVRVGKRQILCGLVVSLMQT